MKKIATILLAVCMIASIAIPASAAELGSSWSGWGSWFNKKPVTIHGDYDGDGDIDYDDVDAFFELVAANACTEADDWNGDGQVNIADVQRFYNIVKTLIGEETTEPVPTEPASTDPTPSDPCPTEPASTEAQPAEYKIHYDCNGGYFWSQYASPAISNTQTVTVEEGKTHTIYSAPQRNACYTFVGWKAADGTIYQPKEKIVVTQDLSLTAMWEYNE